MGWIIRVHGFDSQQGLEIFLFTTVSRPTMRPTQTPIQWIMGALFLGVQWPGHETDHSLPPMAEVKKAWSYTSTHLNVSSWHGP